MNWQPHEDDQPERPLDVLARRRPKVCVACRKIILRKDDLCVLDGKTYCAACLPPQEDANAR